MINFTNLLSKDEGPDNLAWCQVDWKDCSEFMLDQMGIAARDNGLELYVLNTHDDSITWAIGPKQRKIEWLKIQSS